METDTTFKPITEPIAPLSYVKRRVKQLGAVLLLLVVYLSWQLWDIDHVGYADDGSKADCAIVLGAAAYHKKPSPVFKARIDHALKLYQEGRVGKILLTGGFGKNAQYAESEVAYQYCKKRGVKEQDLLLEKESATTEQNIIQAERVMQKNGLETALIVSDPWHLKRALAMASKHQLSAKGSATLTSMYRSDQSRWTFQLRELYYLHVWRLAAE